METEYLKALKTALPAYGGGLGRMDSVLVLTLQLFKLQRRRSLINLKTTFKYDPVHFRFVFTIGTSGPGHGGVQRYWPPYGDGSG